MLASQASGRPYLPRVGAFASEIFIFSFWHLEHLRRPPAMSPRVSGLLEVHCLPFHAWSRASLSTYCGARSSRPCAQRIVTLDCQRPVKIVSHILAACMSFQHLRHTLLANPSFPSCYSEGLKSDGRLVHGVIRSFYVNSSPAVSHFIGCPQTQYLGSDHAPAAEARARPRAFPGKYSPS